MRNFRAIDTSMFQQSLELKIYYNSMGFKDEEMAAFLYLTDDQLIGNVVRSSMNEKLRKFMGTCFLFYKNTMSHLYGNVYNEKEVFS